MIRESNVDLCVYCFQLYRLKHVAIFGPVAPPEDTAKEVDELLSPGEPAVLPGDVLKVLATRRRQLLSPGDTWVERGLNSCNSAPMPRQARHTPPAPD